jgi:hypothetical protein
MTETEIKSSRDSQSAAPASKPVANAATHAQPADARPTDTPPELRFEQDWNRGPYCGPNSLYVLLRLMGQPRSLEEVRQGISVDQRQGASLESLAERATALGLPCGVRFVSAADLGSLPAPYIAHATQSTPDQGELGHFLVVFDYEDASDRLGVIDGTAGSHYYVPRGILSRSFSGYVLVPEEASVGMVAQRTLRFVLGGSAALAGILAIAAWLGPRGLRQLGARSKASIEARG